MRFTPAGKYGGRENWPSSRATGCMSGHPCRAHHKLKWARKLGRCPRASVQASLTLGEQQNNNRSKVPLTVNASPPTQTPQGQPCLTGVGNNPLSVIKPSQRAVSRMPKARRSRLSLTRRAGWAPCRAHPQPSTYSPARTNFPSCPLLYRRFIVFYTYTQNER